MRAYFTGVLGLAAALLALHFAVLLFVAAPIASEYWVGQLISIKQELVKRIPSPKIIFVGGSSTLFGIDAHMVSAELDEPAFNMGLHADMRLDQLLTIAQTIAKPGDIIILPLEHSYYDCHQNVYTDWQLRSMVSWDRAYFANLPLAQKLLAIFTGSTPLLSLEIAWTKIEQFMSPQLFYYRREAFRSPYSQYLSNRMRTPDFRYSAFNIDRFGDIQNNIGSRFPGAPIPAIDPNSICRSTADELRHFVSTMRAGGVRVLVANQPYLADGSSQIYDWVAAEDQFKKALKPTGAQLLDSRRELFFPRSYFFDTSMHLNEDGRCVRTRRLIDNLRAVGIGNARHETARCGSVSRAL